MYLYLNDDEAQALRDFVKSAIFKSDNTIDRIKELLEIYSRLERLLE